MICWCFQIWNLALTTQCRIWKDLNYSRKTIYVLSYNKSVYENYAITIDYYLNLNLLIICTDATIPFLTAHVSLHTMDPVARDYNTIEPYEASVRGATDYRYKDTRPMGF